MLDKRFVRVKFENFNPEMEARIYMTVVDVHDTPAPEVTYEVWFHCGLEGTRWNKLTAATFPDAMTLVADLSVQARQAMSA